MGLALHWWSDYRAKHPGAPLDRLWPRFLSCPKLEHPELYPVAVKEFQAPPAKSSPKRDRVFGAILQERAEKTGILAKEQEVRRLRNNNQTGAASRLRQEVMNDMRRLAGVLSHELSLASSL